MSSRLPSRRFREVLLLVGVSLLLLLGAVVVLVQDLAVRGAVAMEEASARARSLAQVLAASGGGEHLAAVLDQAGDTGAGVALVGSEGVIMGRGDAGPSVPGWWPWGSRRAWELQGRRVSEPVDLSGRRVVVAYRLQAGERAVRVVVPVKMEGLGRWGWRAGALVLLVAGGGALVGWVMIGRALAPYRELLGEAERVAHRDPRHDEDTFLVETFREAVRRLEASEAALKRRADELAVLADVLTRGAAGGVVITDGDGRLKGFNAEASALLGVGLEEGGLLPTTLEGPPGRRAAGDRTLEVQALPLTDADGRRAGEVIFVADQTRLDALERSLQEQQQLASVGELAAGMAHELRNALATVEGYLRLLPKAEPDARERFISRVENEIATLTSVLERFLHFARPQQLELRLLEISQLVREAAARVAGAFPELAVGVTGEAEAWVDPLALGVALENLLRNAGEAGARTVSVLVEAGAGAVKVAVSDDGGGVPDELRARVFTPFATSKPSGGLGLALARRMLRLHGGDLVLGEPGEVTTFVLTLPRERIG